MMDGQFFRAQRIQFEGGPLPVLGIPKGADCTLLLHGDGVNGGTTFTDSSPSGQTATVSSGPTTSTTHSKFGGSSMRFGSGYLQYSGGSPWNFGTGDFTIDFWIRLNAPQSNNSIIDTRPPVDGSTPYFIIYLSSSQICFWSNAINRSSGVTLSVGVWYHVAVTRASTLRIFINGVLGVSSTSYSSNNFNPPSNRPILGAEGFSLGANPVDAWIDELHVQKGTARWTANFTPPSTPYF